MIRGKSPPLSPAHLTEADFGFLPRNLSERCPGAQTNNRAELVVCVRLRLELRCDLQANASQAIARVLETVPQSSDTLIIRTDSKYSQQCEGSFLFPSSFIQILTTRQPNAALTSWSFKWRKNGWKKANGDPVLNKDLMDYILTLLKTRHRSGQPVRLEYVKAHSGDVGNDGADALAVAGCSLPEIPEQDWAGLKETHILEQDMMADLMDGINPDVSLTSSPPRQTSGSLFNTTQDFLLNDEDLMRELEEDYRVT